MCVLPKGKPPLLHAEHSMFCVCFPATGSAENREKDEMEGVWAYVFPDGNPGLLLVFLLAYCLLDIRPVH